MSKVTPSSPPNFARLAEPAFRRAAEKALKRAAAVGREPVVTRSFLAEEAGAKPVGDRAMAEDTSKIRIDS